MQIFLMIILACVNNTDMVSKYEQNRFNIDQSYQGHTFILAHNCQNQTLFQTDCYTLPHTMSPISTMILLTSYLALSSAKTSQLRPEGSLNSRSPTLCTTLGGTKCVFPFTYQSIERYKCTYADSPMPWCATEVESNGTTITNK